MVNRHTVDAVKVEQTASILLTANVGKRPVMNAPATGSDQHFHRVRVHVVVSMQPDITERVTVHHVLLVRTNRNSRHRGRRNPVNLKIAPRHLVHLSICAENNQRYRSGRRPESTRRDDAAYHNGLIDKCRARVRDANRTNTRAATGEHFKSDAFNSKVIPPIISAKRNNVTSGSDEPRGLRAVADNPQSIARNNRLTNQECTVYHKRRGASRARTRSQRGNVRINSVERRLHSGIGICVTGLLRIRRAIRRNVEPLADVTLCRERATRC